jgi:hypothetical protein
MRPVGTVSLIFRGKKGKKLVKEEEEEGRTGRDEMRGSPYTQVNPLIGYTVFWEEK